MLGYPPTFPPPPPRTLAADPPTPLPPPPAPPDPQQFPHPFGVLDLNRLPPVVPPRNCDVCGGGALRTCTSSHGPVGPACGWCRQPKLRAPPPRGGLGDGGPGGGGLSTRRGSPPCPPPPPLSLALSHCLSGPRPQCVCAHGKRGDRVREGNGLFRPRCVPRGAPRPCLRARCLPPGLSVRWRGGSPLAAAVQQSPCPEGCCARPWPGTILVLAPL